MERGEVDQLKQAIEREDVAAVQRLMTANPELHRAPIGYAKNGPLTWVAECRVPWGPPSAERLAMARWMLENGSDVHQGGDGPLMRTALNPDRVPMMELLVEYGADVNADWNGQGFPILFAPCESVNPVSLKWLLEHGAKTDGALDYLIGTYARSSRLPVCIDLLLAARATTRYDLPGVLDILRGRLPADSRDVHRRYPELDFGNTGGRRLTCAGATLLHVAAEFGAVDAARVLLAAGASANETASGGQTPVFHCVTQFEDWGLATTRLLIEAGADLSVRAQLPGHYERPDEVVECTPLGYAIRFPGDEFPQANARTIALLREHGAAE